VYRGPEHSSTSQGNDGERYAFIGGVVARLAYRRLRRVDKGVVMRYLGRTTGYSRPQLARLIGRCLTGQTLTKRYRRPAQGFARTYTAADVTLLAQTDALHLTLSGAATRCLMQRAFHVYGDSRYAPTVEPAIAWAKLGTMVEGARLASRELWG